MKLASKTVRQKLPDPLNINKDSTVGVSFAIDLRASMKKQTDGSYVFDPMLWLRLLGTGTPPMPLQKFTGKIVSIDAATKQLKVQKGEGTNASIIVVNANNAQIFISEIQSGGFLTTRVADFNALKVAQKIEVTGQLNSQGVVEALTIMIGDTMLPPLPIIAIGTIAAINPANKTLALSVESLSGVQTFAPVKKINLTWDDKTKFSDTLGAVLTPDRLQVGDRLGATITSLADPALATLVIVFRPYVTGIVADVTGLPISFVANLYPDPRVVSPVQRKVTVRLTATTKIKNALGADLKPCDITVGSQIYAIGNLAAGAGEMTTEYVVVIGLEVKGVTSDVNVATKTFVVTTENGTKVKFAVNERTVILLACPTCLSIGFTPPDEFIKLIANKPYSVTVFGLQDASGTMQAVSIIAEEKK